MKYTCLHIRLFDSEITLYAHIDVLEGIKNFFFTTLNITCANRPCDGSWIVFALKGKNSQDIIVDYDNKLIRYYYRAQYGFLDVLSIIKEIFTKLLLSEGMIWLHGSAFAIKGKTVIVVAPKGYGKTTWLLSALRGTDALFIANDQFPISLINNIPTISKWKPDIKISQKTLDLLNIETDFRICSRERYLALPNNVSYDFRGHYEITRQKIYPIELNIRYELVHRSFSIDYVVFLSFGSEAIVYLSEDQVHAQLSELFEIDSECLNPKKLREWDTRVSYWRTRITELIADDNAIKKSEDIIAQISKKCRCIQCYSRLPVSKIQKIVCEI